MEQMRRKCGEQFGINVPKQLTYTKTNQNPHKSCAPNVWFGVVFCVWAVLAHLFNMCFSNLLARFFQYYFVYLVILVIPVTHTQFNIQIMAPLLLELLLPMEGCQQLPPVTAVAETTMEEMLPYRLPIQTPRMSE